MKIVESFLFSEAHELEVLFLKLSLSNNRVDHWLICENAYSHQGDYKGLNAQRLLKNDERFSPYLDSIFFIEASRLFHIIDKTKQQDNLAFECENWQRQLAYNFFIQNYSDEDWLVLHDVDEIFDFTDSNRIREFDEKIKRVKKGILAVPRMRYWYDYDNQYPRLYSSVLVTKKYMLQHPKYSLSYLRNKYSVGKYSKRYKNIIVFEYSSCFTISNLLRKLETNPHTGINKQDLLQALRCNHRTMPVYLHRKYLSPKDFFEMVKLDETNSPALIRQNLVSYKTNIVNGNYKQNRRKDYPQLFSLKFKLVDFPAKQAADYFFIAKKKLRKLLMYAYLKSLKVVSR